MSGGPDSWETRYRASLEAEEEQLRTFEDTPEGRAMRFRAAFGLLLFFALWVIGGVALVVDGQGVLRLVGVAVLALGALTVASVAAGLAQGWRPGRSHRSESPKSHR